MNSSPTLWQQELSQSFTSPIELLSYLQLEIDLSAHEAHKNFSLRVPRAYVESMEKKNRHDPLLLQVLPTVNELNHTQEFLIDPVGDLLSLKDSCLIHKYHDRVLFIATGSCAVNCRFCFRRNFPYPDVQLNSKNEVLALQYLRNHPTIHEVIFSGGDPLLLSDQRIQYLLQQLKNIPHIKRIRFHTRLPIVLPSRITKALIDLFQNTPLPIIIVMHCNHANELSESVKKICLNLKQSNITLLNQTVLLKNINDNSHALKALSERLFACGILPYYLHIIDKAKGTSHFDNTEKNAIHLHQSLQKQLSGYLVPKLVKEEIGKANKTWVSNG
jgi:EF-P beta-lysylation protein EpmB